MVTVFGKFHLELKIVLDIIIHHTPALYVY